MWVATAKVPRTCCYAPALPRHVPHISGGVPRSVPHSVVPSRTCPAHSQPFPQMSVPHIVPHILYQVPGRKPLADSESRLSAKPLRCAATIRASTFPGTLRREMPRQLRVFFFTRVKKQNRVKKKHPQFFNFIYNKFDNYKEKLKENQRKSNYSGKLIN